MTRIFSEEIFNPAFVLEGPHLVAASAGTGKTHNIQNIYARLVVEKGFRINPKSSGASRRARIIETTNCVP